MKPQQALDVLEYPENYLDDKRLLKSQFKFFARWYHPDNKLTGDANKFKEILFAYNILKDLK